MPKPKLPTLKPREVIQALQRAGFFIHHTTGSHYYLKHPDKPGVRVSVPYHNRDLKKGTLHAIIKEIGFALEDFLELL